MKQNDVSALRALKAPAGFVDAVLRRVDLLDRYALVSSGIGPAYVATSDEGITAVMVAGDDEDFVTRYRERFGRKAVRADELAADFENVVNGRTRDAAVDLRTTNAFQRDVLEAARRIPSGFVRPYRWIAEAIGRPDAVRAVGTALANNPVPLIVPCHRVVRSDGVSGDYAFGAENKKRLLEHEEVDLAEVRRRMQRRVLWNEEGEEAYCHPYCFAARPLPAKKIVEFATASEAASHGLKPCATCHPSMAA